MHDGTLFMLKGPQKAKRYVSVCSCVSVQVKRSGGRRPKLMMGLGSFQGEDWSEGGRGHG